MTSGPGERRLVIADDEAGDRLDVILAGRLRESRSSVARRIDGGDVSVNGAPARRSTTLAAGDVIEIAAPPPTPTGAAGVAPPPIRYEDADLLVVAKPAGMIVHPGAGNTAGTLVQTLVEAGHTLAPAAGEGRPGLVHRLDRGTSGLLLVAKTDAAYRALTAALRRRTIERTYLALVEGRPPAERGLIDVPLDRDPRDPTRRAVVRAGRPARTRWENRAEGRVETEGGTERVTLIACTLETGRTHQIRVHLAHTGNPVAGDATYRATPDVTRALGLERPFLHAARLGFDHPSDDRRIVVDEGLPRDLIGACRRAGIEPPEAP